MSKAPKHWLMARKILSKRDPELKKIINIDDLEKGLELYKENYSDDTKEIDKEVQFAMYN